MIKIINFITNKKIEKEKEVLNYMISRMDKLINKIFK